MGSNSQETVGEIMVTTQLIDSVQTQPMTPISPIQPQLSPNEHQLSLPVNHEEDDWRSKSRPRSTTITMKSRKSVSLSPRQAVGSSAVLRY
jgi:hypothetical protein